MDDVKENPWSEICWYMPESREQYRLSGKLYIIKSDEKDAELKKVGMLFAVSCNARCLLLMSPAAKCLRYQRDQHSALPWGLFVTCLICCACRSGTTHGVGFQLGDVAGLHGQMQNNHALTMKRSSKRTLLLRMKTHCQTTVCVSWMYSSVSCPNYAKS